MIHHVSLLKIVELISLIPLVIAPSFLVPWFEKDIRSNAVLNTIATVLTLLAFGGGMIVQNAILDLWHAGGSYREARVDVFTAIFAFECVLGIILTITAYITRGKDRAYNKI